MQKTMMFLAAAAAMSLSALSACSPATDEATTAPTEQAEVLLGQQEPTLDQAAAGDAGAALTLAHLTPVGEMIADGVYPDVGAPPLAGQAYGTFATQGDASIGSLSFDVQIPAGTTAIGVPVVTGPSGTGSFTVTGADGAAVATLQNAPGLATWRIWRVNVPANTTSLTIQAQDAGTAWGEWVGIGAPHALN